MGCALAAGAARADDNALAAAFGERFAAVTGDIWANKQAAKFVSEFYTKDAVGTMEGATTVYRGADALTKLMGPFMENYQPMQFHSYRITGLGAKAASQFVLIDVIPKDPKATTLHFKCLYAWTKTSQGWRVASDLCATGGMEP